MKKIVAVQFVIPIGYAEDQLKLTHFRLSAISLGFTGEQADQLIAEAERAAQETLYLNSAYIHMLLERMETMFQRGDSFGEILSWVKACPKEVALTARAECFVPSLWPGGPGQLTS